MQKSSVVVMFVPGREEGPQEPFLIFEFPPELTMGELDGWVTSVTGGEDSEPQQYWDLFLEFLDCFDCGEFQGDYLKDLHVFDFVTELPIIASSMFANTFFRSYWTKRELVLPGFALTLGHDSKVVVIQGDLDEAEFDEEEDMLPKLISGSFNPRDVLETQVLSIRKDKKLKFLYPKEKGVQRKRYGYIGCSGALYNLSDKDLYESLFRKDEYGRNRLLEGYTPKQVIPTGESLVSLVYVGNGGGVVTAFLDPEKINQTGPVRRRRRASHRSFPYSTERAGHDMSPVRDRHEVQVEVTCGQVLLTNGNGEIQYKGPTSTTVHFSTHSSIMVNIYCCCLLCY
jgi:hypothetical protein